VRHSALANADLKNGWFKFFRGFRVGRFHKFLFDVIVLIQLWLRFVLVVLIPVCPVIFIRNRLFSGRLLRFVLLLDRLFGSCRSVRILLGRLLNCGGMFNLWFKFRSSGSGIVFFSRSFIRLHSARSRFRSNCFRFAC
jgi:hypothetical protein